MVSMNEKCKYCNYVSKCSQFCEYNSVICKLHRSFPKIVDKSYEELEKENQQLKSQLKQRDEVIEKIKKRCIQEIYASSYQYEQRQKQQDLVYKVAHERILSLLNEETK